jgi:hypothetical protein
MVMSCKVPSGWRLQTRANGNHRRSNEALRPSARTPVWFGEGAYG